MKNGKEKRKKKRKQKTKTKTKQKTQNFAYLGNKCFAEKNSFCIAAQ